MGAVGVGMGGIGGGQNNAGIPGSMQSQPQPSAPPSMPSMQQLMHVLQNPGHQVMQCMISQVPGFLSMPVQQQLQKMQLFYVRRPFCMSIPWLTFAYALLANDGTKAPTTKSES